MRGGGGDGGGDWGKRSNSKIQSNPNLPPPGGGTVQIIYMEFNYSFFLHMYVCIVE